MRIKEVPNNQQNRKNFRQIARDTCGETCEPPSHEKIVLCYDTDRSGRENLVGAASYRLSDKTCQENSQEFDNSFCHMVTYLFVKGYDQRRGYGAAMMRKMLTTMLVHARRPVRVESAQGAVGFFTKQGFIQRGEPVDCVCSGSQMFSTLVRMEWLQKPTK